MKRPIDIIACTWFMRQGSLQGSTMLTVLQHSFRDAVPVAFGNADPPPTRVGTSFEPFLAALSEKHGGGWLQWSGSAACLGGEVRYPRAPTDGRRALDRLSLQFDAELVRADPDEFSSAFESACRELSAFYAAAHLLTGWSLDRRRTLYLKPGVSDEDPLGGINAWAGLPDDDAWLTWFGRGYASLLHRADQMDVPPGLLVRRGTLPDDGGAASPILEVPDQLRAPGLGIGRSMRIAEVLPEI